MYKTCNFWLSGGAIAPIAPPLNPPLTLIQIPHSNEKLNLSRLTQNNRSNVTLCMLAEPGDYDRTANIDSRPCRHGGI